MKTIKTIKVAYDKTVNLYSIQASDIRSYSSVKFTLDDKEIENHFNAPFIVTDKMPENIKMITSSRRISGYTDSDTNSTISIEEWNSKRNSIMSKCDWDEDKEDYSFNELEDEVAWIRFKRTWAPVYTDEPKIEPVSIEVIEYPVSKSEYIIPNYKIGGASIFDVTCTYNCNSAEFFRKRCIEKGLLAATHENEKGKVFWLNHNDNFRFARINGEYCASDAISTSFRSHLKGTYEELEQRHQKNIEIVDSVIDSALSKMSNRKMNSYELGEMISFLDSTLTNLRNIDVMKSSRPSHLHLTSRISEKLKELRELTLNPNN